MVGEPMQPAPIVRLLPRVGEGGRARARGRRSDALDFGMTSATTVVSLACHHESIVALSWIDCLMIATAEVAGDAPWLYAGRSRVLSTIVSPPPA